MAQVVLKDIGLIITRTARNDTARVEILMSQHGSALPVMALTPDEHPCEAAWRLAKATLGTNECVAYRSLGGPDANGRQWFQTACDAELPELVFGPDGEALTWRPVDSVGGPLPDAFKSVLIR